MKIAFLFSGQGSQCPGMLEDLYQVNNTVKRIFDIADEILNRPISQLCFSGSQEELNLTHNTQPCVLAADLAIGFALRECGIVPNAVAGFSLGEYAALAFAGALNINDAFKIIQLRADAMQAAVPQGEGSMAAIIGLKSERVERICADIKRGYVEIANYNSLLQTVISGEYEAVCKVAEEAEKEGASSKILQVSAPFHCKLMRPAASALEDIFSSIHFDDCRIPVYMNVNGEKNVESKSIPSLLVQQTVSSVQWVKTIENLKRDGVDTFVECGPGKTLTKLGKKTVTDATFLRVDSVRTLDKVKTSLL